FPSSLTSCKAACTTFPSSSYQSCIRLNGTPGCGHHAAVTTLPLPLRLVVPGVVEDGASDLIERLRAGERAAVEEVYVAHHAVIRRFARRLVGDDASAEDVVHDTFVTLPQAIRRFRGDSSLRAFLIGVAVNRSRRHVRSAIRRRRASEALAAHH